MYESGDGSVAYETLPNPERTEWRFTKIALRGHDDNHIPTGLIMEALVFFPPHIYSVQTCAMYDLIEMKGFRDYSSTYGGLPYPKPAEAEADFRGRVVGAHRRGVGEDGEDSGEWEVLPNEERREWRFVVFDVPVIKPGFVDTYKDNETRVFFIPPYGSDEMIGIVFYRAWDAGGGDWVSVDTIPNLGG